MLKYAVQTENSRIVQHSTIFFILLCNKQSRQTREINNGEVQKEKIAYYKRIQ